MAYSKLHASIVGSSLWTEPDTVRILFITLLALCDRAGIVYGTRVGLNRLANIDHNAAGPAWESLLSPDANSSDKIRAPENEGRRIEEVPGGFRLLNFEYYRSLRNDDDRREQNRTAQAKFKAKVSRAKPRSAEVIPSEAEAEAEAGTTLSGKPDHVGYHKDARTVLHLLNEASNSKYREVDANLSIISARLKEPDVTLEGVRGMIRRQCNLWMRSDMEKYLRPETLFAKRKFDSYYANREKPSASADPEAQVNPTTQKILDQGELEEVQKQMRAISGSYSEHQNWNQEDIARWRILKARKVELKRLLGWQV